MMRGMGMRWVGEMGAGWSDECGHEHAPQWLHRVRVPVSVCATMR